MPVYLGVDLFPCPLISLCARHCAMPRCSSDAAAQHNMYIYIYLYIFIHSPGRTYARVLLLLLYITIVIIIFYIQIVNIDIRAARTTRMQCQSRSAVNHQQRIHTITQYYIIMYKCIRIVCMYLYIYILCAGRIVFVSIHTGNAIE